MTSSDERTLAAAQRGDRHACDDLLRVHQPMIWAICRRITADDHGAADAAQEAMIAVVKNLSRFDGRSTVRTWIYRIATNAALDELRRRRRRPDVATDEFLGAHAEVSLDASAQIPDRLLVDEALRRLPADFRAAVVLRDLVDLDYAEIGEILGIPPGTVRSRIARGRRHLASSLSQPGGNPTDDPDRPTIGPADVADPEPPLS
jgi:RNA polymerase sigma-70 factor (ECF subfamily)